MTVTDNQMSSIEYMMTLTEKLEALGSPMHSLALVMANHSFGVTITDDDPLANATRRFTALMDVARGELMWMMCIASTKVGIFAEGSHEFELAQELKAEANTMLDRLNRDEV